MDANFEIQKLKLRLRSAGYTDSEVDSICDGVASEISSKMADAVAEALSEAEALGLEKKAYDFIAELTAIRTGNTFIIGTDSGRTDYSEPPFPMLSRLLKNPKVAKDGSLYKRIPMGKKRSATSSDQVQQDRQVMLEVAKNNFAGKQTNSTHTPDITGATSSYVNSYDDLRYKTDRNKSNQVKEDVTFKTASSKQNPQTQWVLPPKEQNMAGIIMNINANLQNALEEIVRQAIDKYEV